MFIDSHVHFDRFVKDASFPGLLENAEAAEVREMVVIGGSAAANALSLKLEKVSEKVKKGSRIMSDPDIGCHFGKVINQSETEKDITIQ